ncbi:MAG: hypothetical protein ABIP48_26585 [Planctomycetota bacterium]
MENRESVDQNSHRALGLIAARPEVFARQGSVVAIWRRYRGRKLGPYFRLAYREAGRQCSVYLGRAGRVVEAVRGALAELQRPLKRFREYRKARAQIKASLGPVKRELDRRLRRVGLYMKGFEVRGWRTSSLQSFARLCLRKKWGRPLVQAVSPGMQGRASPTR